ncbi:(2Fe-2S)-binding protein [Serratia sp. NPDC078593]|uniref:(2Fe-2S)-binding protein n=1 Tax=unclassified Serratia (in: enterobacteria) TaxID=2647522 RepID=UPI0037D8C951
MIPETALHHEATANIVVTVNGNVVNRTVPVRLTLADFLRRDLALTGTHIGCEQGDCGACTVHIDGRAARSCLMLAVQANNGVVQTIESVAETQLHPLQQAFIDQRAFQCGFCTPGIVMTLLEQYQQQNAITWDETAIRRLLAGHLCRCTGYQQMVEAIREAFSTLPEPRS